MKLTFPCVSPFVIRSGQLGTGICFSESPERAFRARKASSQTAIRLFWKADLLTCFQCKKNQEDCEVWRRRTSALRRYEGNYVTRNRPEKFPDFLETGPWSLSRSAKPGNVDVNLTRCGDIVFTEQLYFYGEIESVEISNLDIVRAV